MITKNLVSDDIFETPVPKRLRTSYKLEAPRALVSSFDSSSAGEFDSFIVSIKAKAALALASNLAYSESYEKQKERERERELNSQRKSEEHYALIETLLQREREKETAKDNELAANSLGHLKGPFPDDVVHDKFLTRVPFQSCTGKETDSSEDENQTDHSSDHGSSEQSSDAKEKPSDDSQSDDHYAFRNIRRPGDVDCFTIEGNEEDHPYGEVRESRSGKEVGEESGEEEYPCSETDERDKGVGCFNHQVDSDHDGQSVTGENQDVVDEKAGTKIPDIGEAYSLNAGLRDAVSANLVQINHIHHFDSKQSRANLHPSKHSHEDDLYPALAADNELDLEDAISCNFDLVGQAGPITKAQLDENPLLWETVRSVQEKQAYEDMAVYSVDDVDENGHLLALEEEQYFLSALNDDIQQSSQSSNSGHVCDKESSIRQLDNAQPGTHAATIQNSPEISNSGEHDSDHSPAISLIRTRSQSRTENDSSLHELRNEKVWTDDPDSPIYKKRTPGKH